MRLDGPGVGTLPLPAGSLGQIRPVSGSEQQILFSHLCKMSYFYLLSGGGWAKPWSPGCCLAPLPRREGVRCPPAPYGILLKQGWRERARQGGEALDKQKSSFSSAVHLAPFLSTKTHLKKNLREKQRNNWCYLLDIL